MSGNYPDNANIIAEPAVLLADCAGFGDDVEAVDISATDHTVSMTDPRGISCLADPTKVIKVDIVNGAGTTRSGIILPAGPGVLRIRGISKVYKTGTTATNLNILR